MTHPLTRAVPVVALLSLLASIQASAPVAARLTVAVPAHPAGRGEVRPQRQSRGDRSQMARAVPARSSLQTTTSRSRRCRGRIQVWFIQPSSSYAAMGESIGTRQRSECEGRTRSSRSARMPSS